MSLATVGRRVEGGSYHWAQRTSTSPSWAKHVVGHRRFVLGYLYAVVARRQTKLVCFGLNDDDTFKTWDPQHDLELPFA